MKHKMKKSVTLLLSCFFALFLAAQQPISRNMEMKSNEETLTKDNIDYYIPLTLTYTVKNENLNSKEVLEDLLYKIMEGVTLKEKIYTIKKKKDLLFKAYEALSIEDAIILLSGHFDIVSHDVLIEKENKVHYLILKF